MSSPFLFNMFYKDMIQDLSNMECGIRIKDMTFNVCCYADDLLVLSTTVTGLQHLMDCANMYIHAHGLRFNPAKTQCLTFGKDRFHKKKWFLGEEEMS